MNKTKKFICSSKSRNLWGRYQHGVSLIEVMVALLILAVGLLGMASLMGGAMQYNHGAQARTQAVLLANDMAERVRANRPNRAVYVMARESKDNECKLDWTPTATDTLAQNDLNDWFNSIACNLTEGGGEVAINGDRLSIAVGWTDTSGARGVGGETEIFILEFDL